MKPIRIAVAAFLALTATTAFAFDIAVEAPDGLEMVFIAAAGPNPDDAEVVFNNSADPIHNRFLDRFYVVNLPEVQLEEIAIICVTHRLPEPKFICVRRGEFAFLPGNDGQVVHIVYPDPR